MKLIYTAAEIDACLQLAATFATAEQLAKQQAELDASSRDENGDYVFEVKEEVTLQILGVFTKHQTKIGLVLQLLKTTGELFSSTMKELLADLKALGGPQKDETSGTNGTFKAFMNNLKMPK